MRVAAIEAARPTTTMETSVAVTRPLANGMMNLQSMRNRSARLGQMGAVVDPGKPGLAEPIFLRPTLFAQYFENSIMILLSYGLNKLVAVSPA
jgi:hypothetical protein